MGKDANAIGHDAVTQADLERYAQAQHQLQQMQAPLLLDSADPHQRLYIAAMDGTGNSIFKDAPEHWSAVGKIHDQLEWLRQSGVTNIRSGYVEGIGTQKNWAANKWDGLTGYTFEQRLETAYYKFCVQAKAWLDEDPQAQIRVAGVGFSRGAELSAALSRVIHERGIMDPADAKFQEANGLITHIEYTRGTLVPPGQTAQALVLFDPVATNITEHDRRIAPSVVGGLALMSQDRRDQFKGTRLLPDGLTEDGRFLSITLPGAHSDVGNSYARNGLGVLSANLAVDYLNSLGKQDFLQKQPVPQDPGQYVIHRSEEHLVFYSTRGFNDGERDFINQLGPSRQCRIEPQPDCTHKAPVAPELDGQIERQPVRIQPADSPPQMQPDMQQDRRAADPIEAMFLRMTDAALKGDQGAMMQVGREYRESSAGQEWLQQGREHNQAQQAQLEQQQLEQQQMQQQTQQTEVQRGPVMHR